MPAMNTTSCTFTPVGVIRNEATDVDRAYEYKHKTSRIILNDEMTAGLHGLEQHQYIDIIFFFHQSRSREPDGAFASRSPVRPNPIGITTVQLERREGNTLYVTGLDAVDNTPVLDIKAPDTSLLDAAGPVHESIRKKQPRRAIRKQIMANDTRSLLMTAAAMHGHYCPGLAMGVMAATHAMRHLRDENGPESDGLEDLLAIVETNNCFADGVQIVTGCSLGNNGLIFRDVGKTAITLADRSGNGLRIISRPESRDYIRSSFPGFEELYEQVIKNKDRSEEAVAAYKQSGTERSFGTLELDFDTLFDTKRVTVTVPDYAPSHHSEKCHHCGEDVMATRTVRVPANDGSGASESKPETSAGTPSAAAPQPVNSHNNAAILCFDCARVRPGTLDGGGIRLENQT